MVRLQGKFEIDHFGSERVLFCYFLQDDNLNTPSREKKQVHLQDFLAAVRALGISFRVYKVGDKWEWTSLLGNEKQALLRKLPASFEKFLPAARVETTRNLWNF